MLGEGAKRLKTQYLHRKHRSICARHKCERVCGNTRGDLSICRWLSAPEDAEMDVQKSAEAIVGAQRAEGPNSRLRQSP